MNILLPALAGLAFLSSGFFLGSMYLSKLEKRSRLAIQQYLAESIEQHQDISLWFKNFDIFQKKEIFSLDPYQVVYDFEKCDLILGSHYLIVVGKSRLLGKTRYLPPTLFLNGSKGSLPAKGVMNIARCQNILEKGNDLEIAFTDEQYKNVITMVLKRIDGPLRNAIIKILR